MNPSLYWHDYETSGLNPALDRPLQFAGVRTDPDLNIIDEPTMLYCQPPLDRLPHPSACWVTGLVPQELMQSGLPEWRFIEAIHRELSRPGTCGVGYNTIRFDDEVTRFCLYRNFYDPYAREWQHGNSRWDIIDMLRLARALRPDGIHWPDHEDGVPSFRLEDLSAANGIEHGEAHDALADVLATIAVARLVKAAQPKLYEYVYSHRTKARVSPLIDLQRRLPFLHVSSRLPRENGYLALMMPLCRHPTNANAIIAFNLMAEPRVLVDLDSDELRQRLFTPAADLPEDVERLALKGVHINRCPIVATTRLLDGHRAKTLGIDLARCEANWRYLLGHDLTEKISQVFTRTDSPDEADVEAALYLGFIPDQDRSSLARVRTTSPEQLADTDINFQDPRYRELLFRYRARYAEHTLGQAERERWRSLRERWLHDEHSGSGLLTHTAYRAELDRLAMEPHLDARQQALLSQLRAWGEVVIGRLAN